MNQNTVHIKATWDSEARVWVASSNDVPGLVTESETTEDLVQKLKTLIPELLEANGLINNFKHPFYIVSERYETTNYQAA